MSINGITVGSGIITVNNSNTLVSTGNLNVANAVNGLTGTVTVLITLSGINHNANGTFRFDNFILNGYVQQIVAGSSTAKGYRYGFNGKEEDDEVKGEGNELDYGMRIYDSRLGRFLSVDPLIRKYPELSPYQFASNTPISAEDIDGKESNKQYNKNEELKQTIGWVIKMTFFGNECPTLTLPSRCLPGMR